MGQKPADGDRNEPSLELPSLSLPKLGRRKDRKKKAKEQEQGQPTPTAPETPVAADAPTTPIPVVREEPVEQVPAAPAAKTEAPTAPAAPPPAAATQPTAPPPAAPAPVPAPAPSFVERSRDHGAEGAPEGTTEGTVTQDAAADDGGHGMSGLTLPAVSGRVAAIITGAVVGIFGTVVTYLAMMGCEVVQGTSSCGRPGFFLLLAVLALMVLLGATLLKAWQLTDPGSTSALAVGVLSVVVLAVLIEVIFSAWMFLLVPFVSALAYALSQWVTATFIEEPTNDRTRQEAHDIR